MNKMICWRFQACWYINVYRAENEPRRENKKKPVNNRGQEVSDTPLSTSPLQENVTMVFCSTAHPRSAGSVKGGDECWAGLLYLTKTHQTY